MASPEEDTQKPDTLENERSRFAELQAGQDAALEASDTAQKARATFIAKGKYHDADSGVRSTPGTYLPDVIDRTRMSVTKGILRHGHAQPVEVNYLRLTRIESSRLGEPSEVHSYLPLAEKAAETEEGVTFLPKGDFTDEDVALANGLLDQVEEARLAHISLDFGTILDPNGDSAFA